MDASYDALQDDINRHTYIRSPTVAGLHATEGVFLYVQVRIHGCIQAMLVPRMLQQVPVADRTFMFKKYRRCFTGTDAVSFLISRRFARTEREALAIGNALLSAGVFRHVRNEHRFRIGNYFYRFAAHEDYTAEDDAVNLRSSRLMTMACSTYTQLPTVRRVDTGPILAPRATMSTDDATFYSFEEAGVPSDEQPEFEESDVSVEIGIRIGRRVFPDLVSKFTAAKELVRDNFTEKKRFDKSFLGRHAAKWLIRNRYVNTTREATAVGNAMMKAGVFFPLDGDNGFECTSTPYRMMADVDFSKDIRRGQTKDFFLKYLLGIDRSKTGGSIQLQQAPWFEDSMSFTTTSSTSR